MSGRQWMLITFVVILNIIIFGALLASPSPGQPVLSPAAWTPHPTFTPMPQPTATAIVMPTEPVPPTPTLRPLPTPRVHVVQEGETLEGIAAWYGTSAFTLRLLNRLPEGTPVSEGQELTIPVMP
ncbi:MAG: LysM peptidoglycan-binding domain-containing protein [Anaerolineae bacterium]|nr:LysM peptidoglycan-binding domain-containing protein [Anaerolineae bacterium]